jgi:transcription antitermination factor NusG
MTIKIGDQVEVRLGTLAGNRGQVTQIAEEALPGESLVWVQIAGTGFPLCFSANNLTTEMTDES